MPEGFRAIVTQFWRSSQSEILQTDHLVQEKTTKICLLIWKSSRPSVCGPQLAKVTISRPSQGSRSENWRMKKLCDQTPDPQKAGLLSKWFLSAPGTPLWLQECGRAGTSFYNYPLREMRSSQLSYASENNRHGENTTVTDCKITHWKHLSWGQGLITTSEVQWKIIATM